MVKAVISNSAAGTPHPDDPNLTIQQVSIASASGLPTSGGTHVYGYNAAGQLVTHTRTVNGGVYVNTYTYNASGQLIGETDWVKQ